MRDWSLRRSEQQSKDASKRTEQQKAFKRHRSSYICHVIPGPGTSSKMKRGMRRRPPSKPEGGSMPGSPIWHSMDLNVPDGWQGRSHSWIASRARYESRWSLIGFISSSLTEQYRFHDVMLSTCLMCCKLWGENDLWKGPQSRRMYLVKTAGILYP